MKLYESPSPNARRVQVFMAEKGVDCERVAVDIRAGENISRLTLQKIQGAASRYWSWMMARGLLKPLRSAAILSVYTRNLTCLAAPHLKLRRSKCGSAA